MKTNLKKTGFIFFILAGGCLMAQNNNYILDADTGNEMDDFYAIVKAIIDDKTDLIGLNSAHYNSTQIYTDSIWNGNRVTNFNTVSVSQAYNEELLEKLGRLDIPHSLGCNRQLGFAWGYYPSATIPKSPAVDFIINEAKKASPEHKLKIIIIGASTNLAAAIETDSTIAKNIHAFLLGARFDKKTNVWNKSEFNIQRDLNAFDVLLNNTDLEMTVMPITTARPYVFKKTETLKRMYAMNHPVPNLLGDIWTKINAAEERVMWDVALVIAIQKPELATLEERPAPPENNRKTLHVYTDIDLDGMYADFWNTLEAYYRKH
ncbi:nucleoside hydrolase [Mariniflexile sp.]|uniref:nucleoside hydrolase n=1 Tax=Mariniflexile sp. TaxID=1979402 RepID=UPI0040484080